MLKLFVDYPVGATISTALLGGFGLTALNMITRYFFAFDLRVILVILGIY